MSTVKVTAAKTRKVTNMIKIRLSFHKELRYFNFDPLRLRGSKWNSK